jgi:hypothetical protein
MGTKNMATIERKPLPPPNSTATTITEADRAEIVARANDVIDYYLNGPGSYFDSGRRKPLVGERGDNTVADLKNFRNNVIAAKQFADDPSSIMDSIIRLIDQTREQVEQAARNIEGEDRISRPPPHTDDPIDDPRVISPRALSSAPLSISLPLEGEQPAPRPQAGGTPGTSSSKPARILSRKIADQSPASAFDTSAPAALDRQDSFGDRFGNFTSSSDGVIPRTPNLAVPPSDPGRPLGIFSGKPMPRRITPPPIWGLPDNSAASGNDGRDWLTNRRHHRRAGRSGGEGEPRRPARRDPQSADRARRHARVRNISIYRRRRSRVGLWSLREFTVFTSREIR